MKTAKAIFSIYDVSANITPADGDSNWGIFAEPQKTDYASFKFNDNKGRVEVTIKHSNSFLVSVHGELNDNLIENPNPQDLEHQNAVIEFYTRAFTALNNLILEYRLRVFDYQNQPIKYKALNLSDLSTGARHREFYIKSPIKLKVNWIVDGINSNKPQQVNLVVRIDNVESSESYNYDPKVLDCIYDNVNKRLIGEYKKDPIFETSLELLLHAQELVINEYEERNEERSSVLSAALITTASACEIFVRNFVKVNGSSLHKFIINEKDRSFSVLDLLGRVLEDIPSVGQSLWAENVELASSIQLLFDARNRSTHKGINAVVIEHEIEEEDKNGDFIPKLKQTECPIRGWMVYSKSYSPTDFGFFTWDVLALMWWLKSKTGSPFINLAIESYWQLQKHFKKGTRKSKLLQMTLDGENYPS